MPAASPRSRVSTDLKTDTMAKTQKGFFSSLFSRSFKGSAKSAVQRPSAAEALSHTPKEPLAPVHNLSRQRSAPQDLTPHLRHNEVSVIPDIPRFKSIKDNLHELGLTTPVVLTQPQVAGSETVLSQLDRTSPRADMFFQRSLSRKTSRTSSQSRPGSSRGNALVASDHAINIELPVLDITSADIQFASPPSATSCLSSGQASQVALADKIAIPSSTAPDTVPSSVQNHSNPSNREPPVPSSPSVASRPSSSHSKHSRITSSTPSGRPRTAPGGSQASELSGRTSVVSMRPQRHVIGEPISLFPVNEGFFGRPKLPPPLKVIPKKVKKHQRTQTVAASPTTTAHERPLTRALSTRSHTTHHRRAPANEPMGLFPIPNSLTSSGRSVTLTRNPSVLSPGSRSAGSVLPSLPSERRPELPSPSPTRAQAPNERSLSRINTQTSVTSHQTQISTTSASESPPAKWTWTPPQSWSGPSSAVSSAESGDHNSKKAAISTMVRLRRPKSSSRSVSSVPKNIYSHPNTSSPTLSPSATTKLGKGPVPPIAQDKRVSPGVIVKMQGHEGDWEEAAVQDVIPRLREMKSSN